MLIASLPSAHSHFPKMGISGLQCDSNAPQFGLSLIIAEFSDILHALQKSSPHSKDVEFFIENRCGKRGRVVDCTGLENQQGETLREFESHRFRQI